MKQLLFILLLAGCTGKTQTLVHSKVLGGDVGQFNPRVVKNVYDGHWAVMTRTDGFYGPLFLTDTITCPNDGNFRITYAEFFETNAGYEKTFKDSASAALALNKYLHAKDSVENEKAKIKAKLEEEERIEKLKHTYQ